MLIVRLLRQWGSEIVGRKTLGQEDSGGMRQMVNEPVDNKAVRQWEREAARQRGKDKGWCNATIVPRTFVRENRLQKLQKIIIYYNCEKHIF
jgi:hypothetical protein